MHARHTFAWVFVALAAFVIAVFALSWFIHPYPYAPTTAYYGYPWWGWGFFPFGFIFFFIFIFFIFRVAFWGWGGWGWRHGYYRYGYGGDSREIIRQRYARGEITKEQFDQMMRDLEQH
jgi:putative membrane protein